MAWLTAGANRILYIKGGGPSGNTTLFVKAPEPSNANTSLYIAGGLEDTSTTLNTKGHIASTDSISLYLHGGPSGHMTLVSRGHVSVNTYATAYMAPPIASLNDNTTLFTNAIGKINRTGVLYIEGAENRVNTYAPAYIFGGTDGWFGSHGSIPLHMSPPLAELARTLFIKNTDPFVEYSKSGYLFIKGAYSTATSSIPLYVKNDMATGALTLYIRTPGGAKNYVPFGREATLFINRPDESRAIPLFLKVFDTGANSFISLHTRSVEETLGSMTLAIPNISSLPVNSFSTLSIEGVENTIGSLTLMTDAHGVTNGTATLMIKQETGYPNSFIALFTKGVEDFNNNNITLAMPDVSDSPTNSIPLYVLGW